MTLVALDAAVIAAGSAGAEAPRESKTKVDMSLPLTPSKVTSGLAEQNDHPRSA